MTINQRPASPHNYQKGRGGHTPTRIIIHVEDGTREGTASWFANPASSVSAHYGVNSDGSIDQFVSESPRLFRLETSPSTRAPSGSNTRVAPLLARGHPLMSN